MRFKFLHHIYCMQTNCVDLFAYELKMKWCWIHKKFHDRIDTEANEMQTQTKPRQNQSQRNEKFGSNVFTAK